MQLCFITAKAIGGQMKKQGSGVILSLTATPAGKAYALVGGFGPACNAIEGFTRNLASELGPYGVRVACIRSAGSPDSRFFLEELANNPEAAFGVKQLEDNTMLGRLPLMADIANVAAFLASDRASGMTGTTVNVTCGTTMD
jgi:NAD(P)-dependent dehydrogenase (short-subunit alcohol dehydrogenase family)